jgi:hypothetical protein
MPFRRPPEPRPDVERRTFPSDWRELVQLAMDGVYPTEARLEAMLDRIEALP